MTALTSAHVFSAGAAGEIRGRVTGRIGDARREDYDPLNSAWNFFAFSG